MKLYLSILIVIFTTGSALSQRPATIKNKAEEYYQKAFDILQNTSHNSLSKALAMQALAYSDSAIALNPSESRYFRVRGTSYFHLKNHDLAIVNFNKAVKLDPTNSLAWMNRGLTYENMEKYDRAEEDYLEALKQDPVSINTYYNLGLLYGKMGKDSLSLLAYDATIELDPNYGSAYLNRGYQNLTMGFYAKAIKDFNIALKFDPQDKLALNNRGLCKFYLKQYDAAILDYQESLKIKLGASFDENYDTDQYAFNNMANAYFELGNIDKACTYWKIAIKKGYQYKPEWKKVYNIDDPKELVIKHCSSGGNQ